MADIPISSGDYIRPLRRSGGQPEIGNGFESTAQSFLYGEVVELDTKASTSQHRLRIASLTGSTCNSTAICGIAAEPASGLTDARRIFFTANRDNVFWARTTRGLLASSNVGQSYGLGKDSTKNVWLVDLANVVSTSQRVTVVGLQDNIGDSGGAVSFIFGAPKGSTNTFGLLGN